MPRPGPRRPLLGIKAKQEAIDHIDRMAIDEGLTHADGRPNRSEMARLLLARGMATWQKGWRPR